MYKTYKTPAIEERTVSGSSVSFHSNFALPLKACKVSFSATQAGSGDPSPSNPRAISGVSAIGLNANSTPVSVSLGDTRYGGELDALNGLLKLTHYHFVPNSSSVIHLYDHGTATSLFDITYEANNIPVGVPNTILSSHFSNNISGSGRVSNGETLIFCTIANSLISPENAVGFKAWLIDNSVEFVYEMATPITVQLSENALSSIIGNNTFSTDTGTLEITFSDLQEKTASGSVASFNTALAMPLPSCNIAVNAWQEGSGDPSPSNVRNIVGVDDITLTINGNTVVIDLNGTRYGGYVDVVNGVAHVTHAYATTLNKELAISSYNYSDKHGVVIAFLLPTPETRTTGISNMTVVNNSHIWVGVSNQFVYWLDILDILNMTLEEFKVWLVDHPLEIAYLMKSENQFDIQLTPTQIETLIGNNTIFADTGDVDLTFNDLDIAKRGSFREVFKLP
jgi:hypothetical protein